MSAKLLCLYLAVVCVCGAPPIDVEPLEKQQPTVIAIVAQSEELESNGTLKFKNIADGNSMQSIGDRLPKAPVALLVATTAKASKNNAGDNAEGCFKPAKGPAKGSSKPALEPQKTTESNEMESRIADQYLEQVSTGKPEDSSTTPEEPSTNTGEFSTTQEEFSTSTEISATTADQPSTTQAESSTTTKITSFLFLFLVYCIFSIFVCCFW